MKIILSRKGFDSGIGKVPSPIFPSGELRSLPIPDSAQSRPPIRYNQIQAGAENLGKLVNHLTRGAIKPSTAAHLDPDLDYRSLPRPQNWKPIFGQAGAAESHLQTKGVQAGDVFLFYGWFRQVEKVAGQYRYISTAPHVHVIFGWLQIERRLPADNLAEIPVWALGHPHCKRRTHPQPDSIYIATEALRLPGSSINLPGAGRLEKFSPHLCLTDPAESRRSLWKLPAWFYPTGNKHPLTYHNDLNRWRLADGFAKLQSAARGQEFILDCDEYLEAMEWLSTILT